ncbi:hypothetical protein [Nocardia jiangsuensis]|uniref:Uncharacterized protein n=1 Tax=Nocardia jiangsuensis TaxID=1691563 RepID=A0ABV8DWJ0_9NOCA
MTLDWGSVPAWAGSILTSGSLGLGFYILLRDRRNDEEDQARQLVVREEGTSMKRDGYNHHVTITNTSDHPFYDLGLTCYFGKEGAEKVREPRHSVVRSWERTRYISDIKRSVKRGTRDSWPLQIEDGEPNQYPTILESKQTAVAKVNTGNSAVPVFMVVHVRDRHGREWGYEPLARTMFRYDRLLKY